ncbi:hypothetical protein GBV73_05440 [Thermococcus sp. 101 C5]|nr:hypothetical protein [Thermococcus bergensis]MCA6214313.1 hypothetical protein [Thermococcus bergensis]MPW39135.1 hypothetical protein [Thermococcus sp. 101 C5]
MTAVPILGLGIGFINFTVVFLMMMYSLLRSIERLTISPSKRARDFQRVIQSYKNGELIEVEGFLILRVPPNVPKDGVYYLLSPLSPSELSKSDIKPYVAIKVTEKSEINAELKSGQYVKIKGIIDAYPFGNMRLIHVISLQRANIEDYWLQYKELALTKEELEQLIDSTINADYELKKALLYSLFASPSVVSSKRHWGEGVTFSAFKNDTKIVNSLWEASRYLISLLPEELILRKGNAKPFVDDNLDLDFSFFLEGGKYYSPSNKSLLKKDIPVAEWAREHFEKKQAVFLTPKVYKRISPEDPLAYTSETPFIVNEPIGWEKNRELEQLIPNLLATIFLEREKIPSLSPSDRMVEKFRERFERWIFRNAREYGEKFDALRLKGMIFETNTRYLLSLRLLGSMARFEGKINTGIISDVINMNQEIVDMWINEIPEREMLKVLETYEKYVERDFRNKRLEMALRVFLDLEATSIDGFVSREEFYNALVEYGFKPSYAREVIESLIADGYLYEPVIGKLKMIKPE